MTVVCSRRLLAAVAAAAVCSSQFSLADTAISSWTGAASTTWSGTGNWASGVPSASVGSLFDGTFSTMPTLGANQASLGLWLKTGVGQDVVINADAARTLTLTAGATLNNLTGIAGFTGGTAILMDDSANHNLTFGPNVALVTGDSTAIINNSAGTLTIQGSIARSYGSGLVFAGNNASGVIDISGSLVNAGGSSFRVDTAGTVILSGDSSSFTQSFRNYGGTVRLTNVNALKAAAVTLGTSSGTTFLQLRSDNDQDTFISAGSLNVQNAGSTINVDRLTAAGGSNKTLKLAANVNLDNNGTLTLTGGNGYGLSIVALTLGNGYSNTATLNPTSANLTVGNVAPKQAIATGNQNLVLGGTTTGNAVTGVISNHSDGGNIVVRKQNSSTWTLSGANTYSGGTTVSMGTLLVNNVSGSGTGSGTVSVNGGTLGGNGFISGAVTITSGGLAPGNSAGKLSFGSSLGLGGTTTMEIIGASRGVDGGYDAIDVTGAMTYGGALVVNFAGVPASQGYNLFDFASLPTASNFSSITLTGAYAGVLTDPTNSGTWQGSFGGAAFTFTRSDGVLNVTVPEPGTVALALGVIGLGCMRRQRRPL